MRWPWGRAAAPPDASTASGGLTFEALFDPDFLARLRPLSLRVARAGRGVRLADQRTAARGQGSDFADYKPYVAGDDLRAIDWNAYRRLGRVFVRVFEERQDLPVHLLVDVSRSMFVEAPPRFIAAQRVALALAAVALSQGDAVALSTFASDVQARLRGVTGSGGIARVARALTEGGVAESGVAAGGGTALAAAVARLGGMALRRGLVVIVSDFFDPAGLAAIEDAVVDLPHRVLLVQVVRARDADPALDADLPDEVAIDDGEAPAPALLTITPDVLDRYRAAYRAFADRLSAFAEERGIGLIRIDADRDVADQLLETFGARGIAA